MRFRMIMVAFVLSTVSLAATPREEAQAFTPEQAEEHAKVLCSRSGLVDVALPNGETRQLCGADPVHAILLYEDVLDLLSRMNTEASRKAWVFFASEGESVTVFNLERSSEGVYQRPRVVFAVASSVFPGTAAETELRKWLAKQEVVLKSTLSPNEGALISWQHAN